MPCVFQLFRRGAGADAKVTKNDPATFNSTAGHNDYNAPSDDDDRDSHFQHPL